MDITEWKEGDDMSSNMEEGKIKNAWEAHFATLPTINWHAYGSCSRCGASVVAPMRELHVAWHKNVTFQMWLVGEWAREEVLPFIRKSEGVFEELAGVLLDIKAEMDDGS